MNNKDYIEKRGYKLINQWTIELYNVKDIRMSYDDRQIAKRIFKSYAYEYMLDHPKMDIQQYDLDHLDDISGMLTY